MKKKLIVTKIVGLIFPLGISFVKHISKLTSKSVQKEKKTLH